MKHYIGEFGFPESVNTKHIQTVYELVYSECAHLVNKEIRANFIEAASVVEYEWDVHNSLGGCGGCKTVDEWLEEKSEDAYENILKPILVDFLGQGYFRREFKLYAHDLVCTTLFDATIQIRLEEIYKKEVASDETLC